jgi:nucleoside 2-deoxyribosyltransferase-like protein
MKKSACLVCESAALIDLQLDGGPVRCCRCGDFVVTGSAASRLTELRPKLGARGIALLSGWLREHWGSTLEARDIDQIIELRMPTVGEKAERVLLHLGRVFPSGGERLIFVPVSADSRVPVESGDWSEDCLGRNVATDLALEAVGFCHGPGELYFLLGDCLTRQSGFLEIEPGSFWPSKITPAGWARIHELQQGRGTGNIGFIAMWFDPSVKPAFEAICKAIAAAGYDPVRLDQVEHNNQIDDEIIARIRGSKFLVADLTGHRGGVYFEAGFALGLGIPVVWLCREDDLDNVHFDNRQYNFIVWREDRQAELQKRLTLRIEATLGRGPLS